MNENQIAPTSKQSPHRVAILINSLNGGGAERVVSLLLQNLHGRVDGLDLIQVHSGNVYPIPKKMHVYHLMERALPGFILILCLPFLALRLRQLIRENNYTVIQSHLFLANYVNVLAGLMGSRHRTVIVNCTSVGSRYTGISLPNIVRRMLIRFFYSRANTLICKSEAMLKDLGSFARLPLDSKTLYNPIPSQEIISRSHEPIPVESFWERTKFRVVCTGRFHPNKRQIDLVEALSTAHKDIGIVFIGDGETLKIVRSRAHSLGIEDRVLFVGRVENPFSYLSHCHVFALPSAAEGFPNVLCEAMICGLPIIATDCLSGPREILAPGTGFEPKAIGLEKHAAGFLVPVNRSDLFREAMELLAGHPELYASMVAAIRQRAKQFDEKPILKAYQLLLSNQPIGS